MLRSFYWWFCRANFRWLNFVLNFHDMIRNHTRVQSAAFMKYARTQTVNCFAVSLLLMFCFRIRINCSVAIDNVVLYYMLYLHVDLLPFEMSRSTRFALLEKFQFLMHSCCVVLCCERMTTDLRICLIILLFCYLFIVCCVAISFIWFVEIVRFNIYLNHVEVTLTSSQCYFEFTNNNFGFNKRNARQQSMKKKIISPPVFHSFILSQISKFILYK